MRVALLHLPRHRRLSWLLCLALLLPIAQMAGAWHDHTHDAPRAAANDDGKRAPQSSHCGLCLVAADVGTAPMHHAAPVVAQLELRQALVRLVIADARHAPLALAYRSRAPPLTPR